MLLHCLHAFGMVRLEHSLCLLGSAHRRCGLLSLATPAPRAPAGGWERHLLHDFGAPVWRLSWSTSGNILSVSDANSQVTLWKESAGGQWQQLQ